jgi:MiaB-like protein
MEGFYLKAAFYTLGCKVNQYDTQMMVDKLKSAGYEICEFSDNADIYIINTCTVTSVSDKKSRQIISRARRNNKNAIILVCGCLCQVSHEKVKELEGVDIVLGTHNRANLLDYINQYLSTPKQIVDIGEYKKSDISNEQIKNFTHKSRAILKIEDGCENFCSYCIIPYSRGRIVSKPVEKIVSEANLLAENGYKELVLTGIHLSSYGNDLDFTVDLCDAIDAVSNINSILRVRLGSLEPRIITEKFIKRISANQKLCPSFHLSLQSGSDKILQSMNRKYTCNQYLNAVKLLRKAFNTCSITTDVIVGFPGESEQDFLETCDFVKKVGFSKIHIFPYSARAGTKAANLNNQVNQNIKAERVKRLEEIEKQMRHDFYKSQLLSLNEVLIEESKQGLLYGYTKNYIKVELEGSANKCGSILPVKLIKIESDHMVAKEI